MTRREARERIMQMLYSLSFHAPEDAPTILIEQTQEIKGKVKTFITNGYNGVIENLEEIDQIISSCLKEWDISRIAKVDHMILRLAVYEIKWAEDVPNRVAINEAVEIAKEYSTEKSPKFINGVLGQVARTLDEKTAV